LKLRDGESGAKHEVSHAVAYSSGDGGMGHIDLGARP